MVNVGRKYFEVAQLDALLRERAWLKLNTLGLHFTDWPTFLIRIGSMLGPPSNKYLIAPMLRIWRQRRAAEALRLYPRLTCRRTPPRSSGKSRRSASPASRCVSRPGCHGQRAWMRRSALERSTSPAGEPKLDQDAAGPFHPVVHQARTSTSPGTNTSMMSTETAAPNCWQTPSEAGSPVPATCSLTGSTRSIASCGQKASGLWYGTGRSSRTRGCRYSRTGTSSSMRGTHRDSVTLCQRL